LPRFREIKQEQRSASSANASRLEYIPDGRSLKIAHERALVQSEVRRQFATTAIEFPGPMLV
jgi:hypothetical protein